MNITRWNILLFVAALLSFCLFTGFLASVPWRPITRKALSEQRIYAYRDWQSSGYTIHPDERYTIRAKGEWLYSPKAGYNGPEGHPIFLSPSFYPLPGVGGGALIGRIGENGQPFYVGRRFSGYGRAVEVTPEASIWAGASTGLLYLRIDDDRLGDNEGYVVVQITVTKPQETD
jgi:hypothetical protein